MPDDKVNILIVDDNPAKLAALSAALDGMDISIVKATSGGEALHQLLAQDFAAVLLDVNMPIMDGFETAAMIRSRPKSAHLPILFITAERFADDSRLKGYELGAVDYIMSPILPQILRSKVAVFADLYRLREQVTCRNRELAKEVDARTAALRESEGRYRLLFENSRDALMTLAPPSWKFTDGNKAALELFGVNSLAEFTMLSPGDISPQFQPDGQLSSEKAEKMLAVVMRDGVNFFEWEHQKPDGRSFAADVLLTRMQLGTNILVQATVRDISGRRELERKLIQAQVVAESEEKFRKITESAHDAIIMMDSDKCISLWNASAERMFGYTAEEAIGREMHPLLAPSACAAFEKGFQVFRETGTGPVIGKVLELTALRKGGAAFPVAVTISSLKINGTWCAIGVFRDITERKLNEEKIRQLAFYDTLTHLPNRRLLKDRLDQAMASGKRSGRYGALMFIDMDNFKPLNDQHGHDMGDLLLIEVAQRITACLREMDTVARFGGDEFVVLLSELDVNPSNSKDQANTVAEKIRAMLAEAYCMNAQDASAITVKHNCTSSIGVVLFSNHEISPDEILKRADLAMYQAKNAGRNQVCFFEPDLERG